MPTPSDPTRSAPDRAALDAFLLRQGPIDARWREGRLRWLRWACAAVAALILLGFTQFADISLTLRLAEVAVAVALLGLFVWLRRASPTGGGVRVDAEGLRLLPDGPQLAPEEIEEIVIEEGPGARRALVVRTRAPYDHTIPLRARLRGHEGRIHLPKHPTVEAGSGSAEP